MQTSSLKRCAGEYACIYTQVKCYSIIRNNITKSPHHVIIRFHQSFILLPLSISYINIILIFKTLKIYTVIL